MITMKKISIVVPVFNEERTAVSAIEELLAMDFGLEKEIIVVNDGSTDRTKERIEPFREKIIYIEMGENSGKGRAVAEGLGRATGDAVVIHDADLEYPAENIKGMIADMERTGADAVYGSRNLSPGRRGYKTYIMGVFVLTKLVNVFTGAGLTDVYTCHKLIRKNALEKIRIVSKGFEFEMEITVKLLKNGFRIDEVPITYNPRTKKDGKKIRPWDGIRGIGAFFKAYIN